MITLRHFIEIKLKPNKDNLQEKQDGNIKKVFHLFSNNVHLFKLSKCDTCWGKAMKKLSARNKQGPFTITQMISHFEFVVRAGSGSKTRAHKPRARKTRLKDPGS